MSNYDKTLAIFGIKPREKNETSSNTDKSGKQFAPTGKHTVVLRKFERRDFDERVTISRTFYFPEHNVEEWDYWSWPPQTDGQKTAFAIQFAKLNADVPTSEDVDEVVRAAQSAVGKTFTVEKTSTKGDKKWFNNYRILGPADNCYSDEELPKEGTAARDLIDDAEVPF